MLQSATLRFRLWASLTCVTLGLAGPFCNKASEEETPAALGKQEHPDRPTEVTHSISERSQPHQKEHSEELGSDAVQRHYPITGLVDWHIARIYQEPSTSSTVVGAARRGTQFRAASVSEGSGCKGTWLRLPGDGYACTAQGFHPGKTPIDREWTPMPPALDSALPYPYGRVVRNNSPQYWRMPTRDEEVETMRALAALAEADRGGKQNVLAQSPASEANAIPSTELPSAVEPSTTPPAEIIEKKNVGENSGPTLPDYVRMRMNAGYYVSLDRYEDDDGQEYFRTIRGGLLRADDVVEVSAPSMRGVILGGAWRLPIAFVWRAYTRAFQHNEDRDTMSYLYDLPRHTPLALAHDNFLHKGRAHVVSREHIAAKTTAVRVARRSRRPPIVPHDAKWLHINLKQQTVVAYQGEQPVFVTLTSTGKQNHKTPVGIFRLVSKHITANMNDFASADEAYSIEDVPWVMYFQGSYGLHGAFWHNRFGQVRSHGCVNLSPIDARWLFQWSEPLLPPGWHSVYATKDRPGTWVVVESGEDDT